MLLMDISAQSPYRDAELLGAWLILNGLEFAGRSAMSELASIDMAGDFDDGAPGWVDWVALGKASSELEDLGRMSSGLRAGLEAAVVLASCRHLSSLDTHNLAVVRGALRAMADAL